MKSESAQAAMRQVELPENSLSGYAPVAGEDMITEIETLAAPLRGARVLHVSATAQGGGVAELLSALVPLMRSVGLDAEWRIISGSPEFFHVTKSLHNGLHGMPLNLTPQMQQTFLEVNAFNATAFPGTYDFVVVHDPQPLPLRTLLPNDTGTWIWRCHIDMTNANPVFWNFVRPYIEAYDAAIFSMEAYARADLKIRHQAIIPPAIDPYSSKNAPQTVGQSTRLIEKAGVDPARPMLVQVSRFDPWKDPLGVVDVYRGIRRDIDTLQLVLLGALVDDDPEGAEYYRRTIEYAGNDPDIHVLLNTGGPEEVNAFQRLATVVLQKSIREGFGLTVTEALWKERPVIGGNVGGIPLQIQDGETGYLVSSVEECIRRVADVLRHPAAAANMARQGHEKVRLNFLSTANLRNYLELFATLQASR
jgi:trehalose synthase